MEYGTENVFVYEIMDCTIFPTGHCGQNWNKSRGLLEEHLGASVEQKRAILIQEMLLHVNVVFDFSRIKIWPSSVNWPSLFWAWNTRLIYSALNAVQEHSPRWAHEQTLRCNWALIGPDYTLLEGVQHELLSDLPLETRSSRGGGAAQQKSCVCVSDKHQSGGTCHANPGSDVSQIFARFVLSNFLSRFACGHLSSAVSVCTQCLFRLRL